MKTFLFNTLPPALTGFSCGVGVVGLFYTGHYALAVALTLVTVLFIEMVWGD